MAKDYQARANWQPLEKQIAPCWAWLIGGLLIGIVFSNIVCLNLFSDKNDHVMVSTKSKVEVQKQNSPMDIEFEYEYEFYEVLPKMDVPTPGPEIRQVVDSEKKVTPVDQLSATHITNDRLPKAEKIYELQVGAFRKFADANRQKVWLGLLGVASEIKQIVINNGEILFRIRSGPYTREQLVVL